MIYLDIETDTKHKQIWLCVTEKDGEIKHWRNKDGLQEYLEGHAICGHNIIGFDAPVLKRVWDVTIPSSSLIDTLILSRLHNPDVDIAFIEGQKVPPPHSLQAWGIRLKCHKIDFTDYDAGWSMAMASYCEQDVLLLKKLYSHLISLLVRDKFSTQSTELEHRVAIICKQMEDNGFKLDMPKAMSLHAHLIGRMSDIECKMQEVFKPTYEELKTPQYWTVFDGSWKEYKAETKTELLALLRQDGCKPSLIKEAVAGPMKVREHLFNAGSRQQIAERLSALGVKFNKHTEKGNVIVDETVLQGIDLPEAKLVAEYLMLQKRTAQISSWMEFVQDDGRVHGRVITNGAVTGRCTHSSPNMGQVPAVNPDTPYGAECREMWTVEQGNVQVGVDLSGIELRCLAHYMQDERWQEELLKGDVHWMNCQAFGLVPKGTVKDDSNPEHKKFRNQTKTMTYAMLYGAGAAKIGSTAGVSPTKGKKLIDNFLDNTPALKKLKEKIARLSANGLLPALDGRKVWVRNAHAALNTLLQSAGAIVAKQWLVECDEALKLHGINAKLIAFVHDETQWEVAKEDAEKAMKIIEYSATQAGIVLKFRCPVAAEGKIGNNWRDCH
jgi:DNA polymerase I-like protein with 3'-5' exonuclease and polymerase domains